ADSQILNSRIPSPSGSPPLSRVSVCATQVGQSVLSVGSKSFILWLGGVLK
ncbi:hypothetical protein JOQ06_000220, partial [Pogonophryne albipinna]